MVLKATIAFLLVLSVISSVCQNKPTTTKPAKDEIEIIPLQLSFNYADEIVKITNEESYEFSILECKFNILKGSLSPTCSPEDCASCSLCSK